MRGTSLCASLRKHSVATGGHTITATTVQLSLSLLPTTRIVGVDRHVGSLALELPNTLPRAILWSLRLPAFRTFNYASREIRVESAQIRAARHRLSGLKRQAIDEVELLQQRVCQALISIGAGVSGIWTRRSGRSSPMTSLELDDFVQFEDSRRKKGRFRPHGRNRPVPRGRSWAGVALRAM